MQFLALGLVGSALNPIARAAPGRTVRLVVPNPAGSSTDQVARLFAQPLGVALNQVIVVDNKPGANGIIAMQDLVRSPPDGSTLMFSSLSPLAINVALLKNLPYDPRKDVTPISGGYLSNQVLMVGAAHPARTFSDFIAYAKRNPGKVSIGHASTLSHAEIAAMAKQAGIDVLQVPYRGIPPAITDVIGGTLDATFVDMVNALGQGKAGQMRALAVTSAKRNPAAPQWPSIAEALSGYDFSAWTAFVGPAGMAPETVSRVHAAVSAILKQQEFVDKLEGIGMVAQRATPGELKSLIDSDIARWTRLVAEYKIQAE
ncbi:Bug family tripartite tricarboxylate transporter substrate binding protein [Variovorax saccharolyticus]|uniref:Bug family tripartite tricarboxylate transporter substrate binding protein n=1 Tax=Variovorax saccharolyticus TaxID=3053516 RepID=UPI0025771268|nr:tripartite tricarboxylate transporter substrate binding protein [Variovorax sp. J22R187]MDM0021793.1 tripartite tricarboxylate transporter substrate binding protein [Variovorax sp. J22R187]